MNVVFDSHIFCVQSVGGISRYVVEIAEELSKLEGVNAKVLAPLHVNRLLSASSVKRIGLSLDATKLRPRIRRCLDRVISSATLAIFSPDIVHTTYYFQHHRPAGCKALVVTVHDMIHEIFPQDFPSTDKTACWKKLAVAAADHVICISKNTQQDLCRILDVDISRTSVIYHGVRFPVGDKINPLSLDCPYILFVGQRGGYKNFEILLQAVSKSGALRDNFKIIAFGANPLSLKELDLIARLGFRDNSVVHMSGDDSILSALYSGASCLVYPSLYEGFGMPLLEAMVMGCPVVAANSSSIPEVVGDAAELFNPTNSEDLASSILKVVESPLKSSRLTMLGYIRAAEFTWAKAAEDTLAVYNKLASLPENIS